jgi:hypothetical protein
MMAMLAGAGTSQGGMFVSDELGESKIPIAALVGTNETCAAEWVLPVGRGGMNGPHRQYLKMELGANVESDGFAAFYFGEGGRPCFSLFFANNQTLIIPPHEYPPASFFEQVATPSSVNWKAQVWASQRTVRVVTQAGETRLPMSDLENAAWQTGLARLLVANASATVYRLDAALYGTILMVR